MGKSRIYDHGFGYHFNEQTVIDLGDGRQQVSNAGRDRYFIDNPDAPAAEIHTGDECHIDNQLVVTLGNGHYGVQTMQHGIDVQADTEKEISALSPETIEQYGHTLAGLGIACEDAQGNTVQPMLTSEDLESVMRVAIGSPSRHGMETEILLRLFTGDTEHDTLRLEIDAAGGMADYIPQSDYFALHPDVQGSPAGAALER